MKHISTVAMAVAGLGGLALIPVFSWGLAGPQSSGPAQIKRETGFYCDRAAIKPGQRKHKEELDKSLRSLKQETRELPDGFEFRFPNDPESFKTVSDWASLERLCCPFFDIDLRLEREKGAFWLRLSGREGVKQFIRSEFSLWVTQ